MRSPSAHSYAHTRASHSVASAHSSPADVEGHARVDALNSLEQHEQFLSADSSVAVVVALHHCVPDVSVIHGRSDSHGQAEIPIGEEELLSLQLSREVHVISLEDHFDVLLQHHVVNGGVPASRVVDHVEAVHALVVHAVVAAPAVEAVHDMLV